MPLIKKLLQPVEVDYVCDECGKGRYRSTGIGLLSSPPQYQHICNECGDERMFAEAYPLIQYVPIDASEGKG